MIFSEKKHQQIHFILLAAFASTVLPLPRFSVLFIILLMINWALVGNWQKKWQHFKKPLPLLFSSVFFMHLIGMFYTENTSIGWANVETKLTLVLFPILLLTGISVSKKERRLLLYFFGSSTVLTCLFALLSSIFYYFQSGEIAFSYKKLAAQIGAHPAYFALYVSFAFFLFLRWALRDWRILKASQKTLFATILVFLFLFLLLLSARTVLLSTLLILAISILVYATQRKILLRGIIILFLGGILASAFIWLLPTTRKRINAVVYQQQNVPNIRMQLWDAALDIYKEKPLLGQGTGDVQATLDLIYQEKNYIKPLGSHLNLHNQYLQIMAALGILGIFFFGAQLLTPLWYAYMERHWLYVIFLGLFMLAILTESMLERQHGVLFFAFFNSLLALDLNRKQAKSV